MKVKAVIFNKARTLTIKILSRKETSKNRLKIHEKEYFITNKDNFVITHKWFGPIKRNYITYYFIESNSQPLPIPNFPDIALAPISPEELSEAFNPAFYRMVRGKSNSLKQDMQVYMMYALLLMTGYSTWQIHKLVGLITAAASGGAT